MKKIKNLIATDNRVRYQWNSELGHIEYNDEESKHIIFLTTRPYFSVDDIKLSPIKNYLALTGEHGCTVVELPNNLGFPHHNKKDRNVYCQTHNVLERLFKCDKRIKGLHFDWHPSGTETKQQIFILTNDNRLRICNSTDNFEEQVILLKGQSSFRNDENDDGSEDLNDFCTNLSLLNLGEAAVCFDFGLSITNDDRTPLWPLYVLMGSSDILLIYTNPDNPSYAENIIGPLTILPQAEDNYGSDACSLIVLDSSPPMIAFASPTGLIYHCFAFIDGKNLLPNQTLYMYECVEIAKDLIENPDDPYIPNEIRLFKDPISKLRYFCAHRNGVHTVVCPIIDELNAGKEITQDVDSLSEFLVCTRVTTPSEISPDDEDSTVKGLGVEIKSSGLALVVLTAKNEIIEHRISPATTFISRRRLKRKQNQAKDSEGDICDVSQIEAARADFEDQIEQILKRSVSIPMLKLSEVSQRDVDIEQLVSKTIATVQSEYIDKYKLAIEAIKKKMEILARDIENQTIECKNSLKDKEEVYASVVGVSTKVEKTRQKQEEFLKRIDYILSTDTFGDRGSNKPKREFMELKDKIIACRNEFDSIVSKHKYNLDQKELYQSGPCLDKDLQLSRSQLSMIKDNLAKQGSDIALLKSIVKSYKSGGGDSSREL